MKPRDFFLLAVAGLIALPICRAGTNCRDELTVTPARLIESREAGGNIIGSDQLILIVSGQATKRVVAYANFRIDHAIDDAGEDLIPSDDLTLKVNSRINSPNAVHRSDGAPSIWVTGLIQNASRRATKITHLVGQVQLMTLSDESRNLIVPKLASFIANGGKDTNLAKERLSLQIDIDNGDKKKIYAFIGGNPTIVRKIQIIGDKGQVLSEGNLEGDFSLNTKHCFFELPRDVDDQMSLKFEVAASQKVLTVPFDFKDIPLP